MAEDNRRLSISEEALGAFGKSQTYRVEGTTDGRKQNGNKSKSCKIGEIKYRQNITCCNCNQKGHFQNQCSKLVASRDKVVNIVAGDSDDTLLERFKLRSGKVLLADDKTLDIAGVRDVVLKTSFGTSWTLKDVRYIPGLIRRLISVGQLDEEGYHRQRLSDMSRIGMNMLASKGNITDVRKRLEQVHIEGYGPTFIAQSKDPTTMILLAKTAAGVAIGIMQTFR
ncbi:retrovirus-related pol polyprotein from transposon TNT 1-94 [Tanacetum coccineum]